jgi:hypothetical protein
MSGLWQRGDKGEFFTLINQAANAFIWRKTQLPSEVGSSRKKKARVMSRPLDSKVLYASASDCGWHPSGR